MKLNVIKNRYTFFIISGLLLIMTIFIILFGKLNLGIDMTGGTQAEYSYQDNINIENIRTELNKKGEEIIFNGEKVINDITAYTISGVNELSIITGFDNRINNKELEKLKATFREDVLNILKSQNSSIEETSYTNIGKSFGDYIKNTAIITLLIAIVAIALYVTWAFSGIASGISVFSFSMITIVTLLHDVIISSGLYILSSMYFPEFKIDTFFITALLTILGYSINDTIVVFDRTRANLKNMVGKNSLEDIIERSVSETLRRSIFTSLTLFLVLLTIFFFGPESISGFILAMIFGTVIGTYSSIFIASPMLYEFNKSKKLSKIVISKSTIEDKIVV